MPDLGAELEVETTSNNVKQLNRRCSYEEVVHHDEQDEPMDEDVPDDQVQPNNLEHSLVLLTKWALILQEITAEFEQDNPKVSCLCRKFEALRTEFVRLEALFHEVIDLDEEDDLTELTKCVKIVGDALRSGISIQISNPSDDVRNKANYLVAQICDVHRYVFRIINYPRV